MANESNQMELLQLDCHFKWFHELNIVSNGRWLSGLLDKKLHNDLKVSLGDPEVDKEEDTVEDLKNYSEEESLTLRENRLKELSWRFTLILRYTYEGKFQEAFEKAEELLNLQEAKTSCQPQVHIDTYAYVVLANQLNILKKWRSSSECPMDENLIDYIASRMEPLKNSIETNEGKAFINIMKCYLARDMLDTKQRIDFAKKAVELNPQFAGWHQSIYMALREQRRSTDFRQSPSEQEIGACKKVFELESGGDPNNISVSSAVSMSLLYGELLLFCKRGSREHQETSEQAVKFARVAVLLKPSAKRFKMRLADLLSGYSVYRRFPTEGLDEAQKIFKECEIGECSSEMCHKIGKFYSNRLHKGYNSAKGLEWFEKGLKAHVGNFPCFMDMLRNLHFQRKSLSEIIQAIDIMLSSQTKHTYKCQLMFIKGFFLWITDQEATLDLWLMTMEEAGDLEINFSRLATGNFCFMKDRNASQALSMMENVKELMNRRDRTNDRNFTKLVGVVNSVITNLERQRHPPRYIHKVRGQKQDKNNIEQNWRK